MRGLSYIYIGRWVVNLGIKDWFWRRTYLRAAGIILVAIGRNSGRSMYFGFKTSFFPHM